MDRPDPDQRLELADPAAYEAMITSRIAGRDPLELMAQAPDALRRAIADVPIDRLRLRPYADRWTWTPVEVIGHLLDCEWMLGWRARTVLADEAPTLTGMDQDRWVAAQPHADADPHELIDAFAALRQVNLSFWRAVPDEAMARTGHHTERGEQTLEDILRFAAGHDLHHLDQLRRYVDATA